ncbi:hypothetical protein PoB_002603700 [Plakobranchus ocellatus]|uniref:Uncharacterized protein n=1 Tax=Plakobranchus ocellatus TaxID=259542 RepID=A0AAV3ZY95_9GAST|nr:hypothetical protein PoB_002603700 [Plakobranchus ocellatus]
MPISCPSPTPHFFLVFVGRVGLLIGTAKANELFAQKPIFHDWIGSEVYADVSLIVNGDDCQAQPSLILEPQIESAAPEPIREPSAGPSDLNQFEPSAGPSVPNPNQCRQRKRRGTKENLCCLPDYQAI